MRTFYIISETEMKEVGMQPPELEPPDLFGAIDRNNARVKKWHEHLAAAPVFQHRLNVKVGELVNEADFIKKWLDVVNEVGDKSSEWVAIPKEEKRKSVSETMKELREMGSAWDNVKCVCEELGRGKCECNCPKHSENQKEEKEERTFTEKDMESCFDAGYLRGVAEALEKYGISKEPISVPNKTEYLKQ